MKKNKVLSFVLAIILVLQSFSTSAISALANEPEVFNNAISNVATGFTANDYYSLKYYVSNGYIKYYVDSTTGGFWIMPESQEFTPTKRYRNSKKLLNY